MGKSKIKLPKTKLEKLKINHIHLIIICVLLGIVLLLLFIPKNNNKEEINEKKTEKTTEKKEEILSVYDVNSNTRPYAVMIPNDSAAKKRQSGLEDAYIIYEITVEGGITRLLALFKDKNVEKIGPVRSSRHYYLDYALENDAIYVHFGWSPQAESDIKSLGINNLNGLYNPSNMFWRDKNYSSPNNAYTSSENIQKAVDKKEYRKTSDNFKLLNYTKNVDLSSDNTVKDAKMVKVYYSGNSYVKYVYDDANKYYLRYNNENKHVDILTNNQIHMKNILVLKMDTINISGDDKGRQNLNNIGTGEGIYITNGKAISITWSKESRESKTIYKDSNGKEIQVSDGNTFIQIQPTSKETVIE